MGIAWLTAASLFFYAWWNPPYLLLLLGSVALNFLVASALNNRTDNRKALLGIGVTVNLLLIGYYKYAHFLVTSWNGLSNDNWQLTSVTLPLAISFFTFQQIAFLLDTYRGEVRNYGFREYLFFVVFFPQLIAGPIVKHDEIIPQIANRRTFQIYWRLVAMGLTIFSVGLFKKVIVADYVSIPSDRVFELAGAVALTFAEAWLGAIAYAMQIHFDFSGYSDMAIGLAGTWSLAVLATQRRLAALLPIVDLCLCLPRVGVLSCQRS